MTRAQMAVFLLKSQVRLGPHPSAVHRDRLHRRALHRRSRSTPGSRSLPRSQITSGCGGTNYPAPATLSPASKWPSSCSRPSKARRTTIPPPRASSTTSPARPVPASPTGSRSSSTAASPAAAPWRRPSTVRRTRTTAARWRCSSSRRSDSCSTAADCSLLNTRRTPSTVAPRFVRFGGCRPGPRHDRVPAPSVLPPRVRLVSTSEPGDNEPNRAPRSARTGDFVVAWTEDAANGEVLFRPTVRRRHPTPLGGAFPMNAPTRCPRASTIRRSPAMHPSGRFVVVWTEGQRRTDPGQRFASDGTPLGGDFEVSTSAPGLRDLNPLSGSDPVRELRGRLEAASVDGDRDVMARRFDSDRPLRSGTSSMVNAFTIMATSIRGASRCRRRASSWHGYG